jgi:hypothetical protein
MLRRRSRAVAEHSQHMLGKAMDTTMSDMSMERLREIGMRLQRGGVGYYPTANFVHLDVGSVRHWPRMSYDQLVRLFPDGKTVHIPSNGQPLARYEEARAEIEANGGMAPSLDQPKSKGFFAWLFGGSSSEDDAEEVASATSSRSAPTRVARGGTAPATATAFMASATAPAAPSLAERYGVKSTPAPAPAPAVVPAPAPTPVAAPLPPRNKPPETDIASADDKPSPFGNMLPTPPRRPSDLLIATVDVPLPPSRPAMPAMTLASLSSDTTASIAQDPSKPATAKTPAQAPAKPDMIATLISVPESMTSSSKPDAARPVHPQLPSVITQGPDGAKPSPDNVLAYAPSTDAPAMAPPLPGLRSAAALVKTAPQAMRGATPNAHSPIVSARLDGSNFRSLTNGTAEAMMPSQSVLGPALSGLRAAARIEPGTLSNRLSADYVARFASNATNLDCDHFTGAAIQPLPSAAAALQQVARLH